MKLNCSTAEKSTEWSPGDAGAGSEISVFGILTISRFRKKAMILSKRSGVVTKIAPMTTKNTPAETAPKMLSLCLCGKS